jgi:hypothetical protein
MAMGDLGVVERWLAAVNGADVEEACRLSAEDIEIVGPRGVGRGRALLADWLSRAGFSSMSVRWFCGDEGRVVVEQDATWAGPPGAGPSRARVASAFVVKDNHVARFQRFEHIDDALAASRLDGSDEVTGRSAPGARRDH